MTTAYDMMPLLPSVADWEAGPMPQGLPRGAQVHITSGRYAGRVGFVDANVFQRTVDYPDELALGYHVLLGDGTVVTVRRDHVVKR